ncbi:LacI family DNA-binding transcriptional regulator [Fictibacillus terranigra]|uniref:LacI family DNA-binding transcriptional regulator n=1 Tax=Fictibacillus terranigra TaxID=3058424 RepID=A0ABT8E4Z7_9BACL|nr:LacI family DNA-binding transcriptional regulator [Fictibacillus sp. CENA-BCM004]MDN4072987.1 LacI family DNA-binding transcriptional regulator [Fictibacillus sp. CENA-BCM004]
MNPTIRDVAKLANTSKSTVSRFLNGQKIKKETEEALKQAIKDLNYHRNENARRLVMNKTQTIGVVVDNISNVFYSTIFGGIEKVAMEKGFNCVFYSSTSNFYTEGSFLDLFYEGQVDGIILVSFSKRMEADLKRIAEVNYPIVLVGDSGNTAGICSVDVDNFFGISETVKYLHRIGHENIAYISGPENASATGYRLNGYLQTMRELGLEIRGDLLVHSDWSNHGGYNAMNQLLNVSDFTAVIASNDETAIGALRAIHERGYDVPNHLSITGFDDIALASWVYPSLTTVKQPFMEMGEKAAGELFARLESGNESSNFLKRHLLKPKLVIRDSCRKRSRSQTQ